MKRRNQCWRRNAALVVVAVALWTSACSHGPGDGSAAPQTAASGKAVPTETTAGVSHPGHAPKDPLAAFELVRTVLQDPRCQNCHPPGDSPLQGDDGHPHSQNVVRGLHGDGPLGEGCSTCHGSSNPPASYGLHIPPGAPGWRLPPPDVKMVFVGQSSGPLCQQLKDPKRNGGKDLGALLHHVSEDKLVLWGWSPGLGRRPVGVSHADFVAAFGTWVAADAPCPP